ncbi:unnamed protein product [Caenorhabditis angaria]|uniref:Uncharacterized protein n=1 Tax=Caenorhabditis angaria TaxID=860376 RepID=A0A9P1N238_9PELO|nr:unnamed protein product [Caenorhabditis angaria]
MTENNNANANTAENGAKRVNEFHRGTTYNGFLPVRPDMSEEAVLIRKYKMYSILFLVLALVFFISTIVISIILGINVKSIHYLEDQLEICIDNQKSAMKTD